MVPPSFIWIFVFVFYFLSKYQMCSWGKRESNFIGMPTYIPWKKECGEKKGVWHNLQLRKFLNFVPEAAGANVIFWLRRHNPNPRPNYKIREAAKHLKFLKNLILDLAYKYLKAKKKNWKHFIKLCSQLGKFIEFYQNEKVIMFCPNLSDLYPFSKKPLPSKEFFFFFFFFFFHPTFYVVHLFS